MHGRRPFFCALLRGVLCAASLVPLVVTGSVAFKRNGTAGGPERADRGARFVGSFGTGYGSGGSVAGFGGTPEAYELYVPAYGGSAGTVPRSGGSELVRLYEGGDSEEEDFEGLDGARHAFTDQPFPRDQPEVSLESEDLQLFRPDQFDQPQQRELYSDPFAQSEVGVSDGLFSNGAAPVPPDDAGFAGDARSSFSASAVRPNQSRDFVRGMLQRFGVTRGREGTPSPGPTVRRPPSANRFRPHFVNTSKGLRNIPHQLNDGQLQLAPDDAAAGSPAPGGAQSNAGGAGAGGGAGGGRPAAAAAGGPSGSTGTIGTLLNSFKRKLKAIYPGTVWCGDGNQAKSEDDIGFFYLTDSCCRAHDLCPITIAAGEQFNRLKNNGHFTRSHCDCDKQFFNCLKNANTLVSRQIGYTYFNLLKPQCFRYEHPKVNCNKRSRGKCLTYVVDEKQSKRWQWFDNLIF